MKKEQHKLVILGLFLMVSLASGSNAVTIRVSNSSDSTGQTKLSFNFDVDEFSEFYDCLCQRISFYCRASFNEVENRMMTIQGPIRNDNWPDMVRYYVCDGYSNGVLFCTRKAQFNRLSYKASGMRFFHLPGRQRCDINCIGIMWTFEKESLIYDHQLVNLETCNADFYMSGLSIRDRILGSK